MRRSEPVLRRLLLVPGVLFIALFVGLQAFHTGTAPAADVGPSPTVRTELPPLVDSTPRCQRDRTGLDGDAAALGSLDLPADHRVSSAQLLGCPAAFDGERVIFVGEAVGDLLARDGGAWMLVNDDEYALEVGPLPAHRDRRGTNSGVSVWLPERLQDRLTGLGGPGQRGDLVRIEGVIRRVDPSDGGGLTLRADTLEVLAPAAPAEEPLNVAQVGLAAAALALAGGLWSARRLRPDR